MWIKLLYFQVYIINLYLLLITDCDDFLYGIQCLGRCNCLNPTEICNTMTGHCKSGCPNGWFGSSCNSKPFTFIFYYEQ